MIGTPKVGSDIIFKLGDDLHYGTVININTENRNGKTVKLGVDVSMALSRSGIETSDLSELTDSNGKVDPNVTIVRDQYYNQERLDRILGHRKVNLPEYLKFIGNEVVVIPSLLTQPMDQVAEIYREEEDIPWELVIDPENLEMVRQHFQERDRYLDVAPGEENDIAEIIFANNPIYIYDGDWAIPIVRVKAPNLLLAIDHECSDLKRYFTQENQCAETFVKFLIYYASSRPSSQKAKSFNVKAPRRYIKDLEIEGINPETDQPTTLRFSADASPDAPELMALLKNPDDLDTVVELFYNYSYGINFARTIWKHFDLVKINEVKDFTNYQCGTKTYKTSRDANQGCKGQRWTEVKFYYFPNSPVATIHWNRDDLIIEPLVKNHKEQTTFWDTDTMYWYRPTGDTEIYPTNELFPINVIYPHIPIEDKREYSPKVSPKVITYLLGLLYVGFYEHQLRNRMIVGFLPDDEFLEVFAAVTHQKFVTTDMLNQPGRIVKYPLFQPYYDQDEINVIDPDEVQRMLRDFIQMYQTFQSMLLDSQKHVQEKKKQLDQQKREAEESGKFLTSQQKTKMKESNDDLARRNAKILGLLEQIYQMKQKSTPQPRSGPTVEEGSQPSWGSGRGRGSVLVDEEGFQPSSRGHGRGRDRGGRGGRGGDISVDESGFQSAGGRRRRR